MELEGPELLDEVVDAAPPTAVVLAALAALGLAAAVGDTDSVEEGVGGIVEGDTDGGGDGLLLKLIVGVRVGVLVLDLDAASVWATHSSAMSAMVSRGEFERCMMS